MNYEQFTDQFFQLFLKYFLSLKHDYRVKMHNQDGRDQIFFQHIENEKLGGSIDVLKKFDYYNLLLTKEEPQYEPYHSIEGYTKMVAFQIRKQLSSPEEMTKEYQFRNLTNESLTLTLTAKHILESQNIPSIPFAGDIVICFSEEDEYRRAFVPREILESNKFSFEKHYDLGLQNLSKSIFSQEEFSYGNTGGIYTELMCDNALSLMLFNDFWDSVPFQTEGSLVIKVINQNHLLYTNNKDFASLQLLDGMPSEFSEALYLKENDQFSSIDNWLDVLEEENMEVSESKSIEQDDSPNHKGNKKWWKFW
jgi:hypothetical protein